MAVDAPEAQVSTKLGRREFILLVASLSALAALPIDMTLPAFADMREEFDLASDATDLSLVITLFVVGRGFGVLFAGPLADAVGRKGILLGSLTLYALASVGAAIAPTLIILYASRLAWGVASAGPRVVSQAVVRDKTSGAAMARIMTLVQTAFFLAPVLGPLFGRGILEFGSWRYVMAFSVVAAAMVAIWSIRLEETLAPENRRPLRLRSALGGFRLVVQNRTSFGYMLAAMFGFGALYSFIASTELIFDDVYNRRSWFVPFFTFLSLSMIASALLSSRLLRFISPRQLSFTAGMIFAVASLGLLASAIIGDGAPPIVLWVVLLAITNGCHVSFYPSATSLALEPMGALAGTAAGVLGFMTSVGGALLGSIVDRFIDGSVTPMAIGFVVYSSSGLACQIYARTDPDRIGSARSG
jgi:DHA1 family bicyclomycin/chloramphenicol resistance-like MFS transporter